MKLLPGQADEYKSRHDAIWPELKNLLRDSGITDYSIYLDEETGILFGSLKAFNREKYNRLSGHPVMKKWWAYMQDIMETHPDDSPVSIPLREVFYME